MCPPEDALSPSSPVLHTAHIMRCIKYLLVFVRLGLHFLHLKTIKNRNREAGSSPPLASCLCVEGRIDSRAELQISTPPPLPPSSPSAFFFRNVFVFTQSVIRLGMQKHASVCVCARTRTRSDARAHLFRLVLMHVGAHAPWKHLRACTLHFRRHIIHRPRGHVHAEASSIWPLS